MAERFGTPLYVYSRAAIEEAFRAYQAALVGYPHRICYAVKANGSLAVLNVLAELGAGFDIVSGGELERVLAAGGDPHKIVFSGVGKRPGEIRRALEAGILCFNIESEAELELLDELTRQTRQTARISVRVNPDVDARTHPHISTGLKKNKFGLPVDSARAVYKRASEMPYIRITGVDCHIGSQITEISPFIEAFDVLMELVDEASRAGIPLSHVDIGGGLGVRYKDREPPSPQAFLSAIRDRLGDRPLKLLVEPGRSLVAHAGVLLAEVLLLKESAQKNFAVVDAAMNDLLRPALYGAWHEIMPVNRRDGEGKRYDVVGPVCESSDTLGKDRSLSVLPGDLVAVRDCGAYGFVMSSNYNARPRPAEVMLSGGRPHLIRRRESFEDLVRGERVLPSPDDTTCCSRYG